MRKYNIYEEIARTLVGLGTAKNRQKEWKQAEQYLLEAEEVCLERHKSWYLAEIYTRLAEALFKQEKLTQALPHIKLGLKAIKNRSNPDWRGPLLALSADIARQQNRPEHEITRLYLRAVQQANLRSRAINRNQLYIHVGTQLLTHNAAKTRQKAEQLILEGMAWLQSQGEDVPET